MKLAISNIAWDNKDDNKVYEMMKEYNFSGLEIAPSKIYKNLQSIQQNESEIFLKSIKKYNFALPAMQSLLYNRADLEIFSNTYKSIEYLKKIIDIAEILGIRVLVFGSPKNRNIKELPYKIAFSKAVEIFYTLGEYALSKGSIFCIEPNAVEYGCNFITNTKEAIELVSAVNCAGFGLHFDSAVAFMNGENLQDSIYLALPYIQHLHISSPYLKSILENKILHKEIAAIIKNSGYDKWVSIEMKKQKKNNLVNIKQCLEYIRRIYE